MTTGSKHGMVGRAKKIRLLSLVISIAVHVLILAGFTVARFSQSQARPADRVIPATRISQVRKFVEASPIVAKPKVKYSQAKNSALMRETPLVDSDTIFAIAKGDTGGSNAQPAVMTRRTAFSIDDSQLYAGGTSFFGSSTNERRICYVVDCSGSMKGLLSKVKTELCSSIEKLEQDQYFGIIFYGDGRIVEFNKGRLTRATTTSMADAKNFIERVESRGNTNALTAIERAMKMRDVRGTGTSVIYFLTDGFELGDDDSYSVAHQIATLRRSFAEDVRINTIGFWPSQQDKKLLQSIANETGGEYIVVDDNY